MDNFKNVLLAILPFILIGIIFFSPFDFDYLIKKQFLENKNKEKFTDSEENSKSHPVDFPVKNSKCTKRGKQLLDVQEFMAGKTYGCYTGKEFW